MGESRAKEIHAPYQTFYITSMFFNSAAALRSIEQANAMLVVATENSPENPYGVLYGTRFLSELQNLIIHAGALSRYFWPANKDHEWRGAELRNTFGISGDSPLKKRDLRNAIEHFDERLDNYLAENIVGRIFPEYIGPTLELEDVPTHIFRAYYVDSAKFQLLDRIYNIQPIVNEVGQLHSKLYEMDRSGGVFAKPIEN